eukprot:756046-Prymnesium_polylepis.1
MRGTVNADRPQDAGKHPHRAKWQALSAPFASPQHLAGMYFYLDMWEFFGTRHELCLSNARFGGFGPGHHRHEMVVCVANDLVWYRAARKDLRPPFSN